MDKFPLFASLSTIILVLIAACAAEPHPGPAQRSSGLLLVNVTVVDVEAGVHLPNRSVFIDGGMIRHVGEHDDLEVSAGVRRIDGTGRFLVPGLWDMHVHVLADWENAAALFVGNGVTGVRNLHSTVEDPLGLALEIQAGVESGTIFGPNLIANGPILDGPQSVWPGSVAVGDAEQARAAVRELHARGADFIKPYDLIPEDAYRAAVDEALKLGIPVDGHVPATMTTAAVSDAGQRSIEHFHFISEASTDDEHGVRAIMEEFFAALGRGDVGAMEHLHRYDLALVERHDPAIAEELLQRLAANQTWLCPTFRVMRGSHDFVDPNSGELPAETRYVPAQTLAWWMLRHASLAQSANPRSHAAVQDRIRIEDALLRRAFEVGVPIVAGTDVGNPFLVPGFSLLDELEMMADAGVSPAAVLRSATLAPAELLGRKDAGLVEAGRRADLVLLDEDPLHDISALRRIHGVVRRGVWYDRKDLDRLLAEVEARVAAQADP